MMIDSAEERTEDLAARGTGRALSFDATWARYLYAAPLYRTKLRGYSRKK